jgi:hypothetical protein
MKEKKEYNPNCLPSNVKNNLVKLSNFVFNLIKTIDCSKLPPHEKSKETLQEKILQEILKRNLFMIFKYRINNNCLGRSTLISDDYTVNDRIDTFKIIPIYIQKLNEYIKKLMLKK